MLIYTFQNIDFLLKLTLALIMFSVGLSLKIADFKYVLNHSRLIFVGLFSKLILLPLLGFLLLELSGISATYKLGTMILLLCAGGTTSNVITYWFKGTTALTIFLTMISSFLIVFTLPVLTNLAGVYYFGSQTRFSLSVSETTESIFLLVMLPTFLGLILHEFKTDLANKFEKIIKPASVILLGLVYLIKFFAPSETAGVGMTMNDIWELAPILLLINAAALFLGFFVSRFLKINPKNSMTIGIEMGIQNPALAILIATVFLGNEELAKPALLYAMFTFWTTIAFAWLVHKKY